MKALSRTIYNYLSVRSFSSTLLQMIPTDCLRFSVDCRYGGGKRRPGLPQVASGQMETTAGGEQGTYIDLYNNFDHYSFPCYLFCRCLFLGISTSCFRVQFSVSTVFSLICPLSRSIFVCIKLL